MGYARSGAIGGVEWRSQATGAHQQGNVVLRFLLVETHS